MKRKIFAALLLCILLYAVKMDAWAAEGIITVRTAGEGVVELYRVAEPEGVNYRLLECYGGGLLSFDDTLSSDLAAWLTGRVQDGITRETEEGAARFPDLEEGLYLVVQTGGTGQLGKFAPFFVCIPWDGSMWQVEVTPFPEESPQTGDCIWLPLFLFLGAGSALIQVRRKMC